MSSRFVNESVLEEKVYTPIARWLTTFPRIGRSMPELWLGVSIFYSLLIFVTLWIEVGYWPWWMFVILWVTTQICTLCTSLSTNIISAQERSIAFDTMYWAHVTFSTHAGVLGALHVLDVGSWGTLICTTIIGFHLYAPHWAAVKDGTLLLGRWTSPSEVRFFATTFAVGFSPFHPHLHGTYYGSTFAVCASTLLFIPMLYQVYRPIEFETNRRTVLIILFHFCISALPSIGMAWWTWLDIWLADVVPVTFAGVLVLINTEMIARSHFDRCFDRRTTVLTPLDIIPFLGVANAYLKILPQPLSIVIIYMLATALTALFLLRVSLRNYFAATQH